MKVIKLEVKIDKIMSKLMYRFENELNAVIRK
jgi:hypothetical protein